MAKKINIAKPEQKLTEQQVKCKACRECCEYIEIPTTMLSIEVVEYYLVRGEQFYINPDNGVFNVRIYKPCIHLTKDGCGIYDKRPPICREFMCPYKSDEVKKGKERICAETMEMVRQRIEKFKEEQK